MTKAILGRRERMAGNYHEDRFRQQAGARSHGALAGNDGGTTSSLVASLSHTADNG